MFHDAGEATVDNMKIPPPQEQPHFDVPVDNQAGNGEVPPLDEQNTGEGVTAPPPPPSPPVQQAQTHRGPVSLRLGPRVQQPTPEGHIEDLTSDRERELFEPGVVQRPSPVIRPYPVALLPPPPPGIEELLRNYLTATRGREFLNQYGEEQRAPHLGTEIRAGPYGMPGGQDRRQHLQQIRGQPQGVPPPPPPHYVVAPPPPHGVPPHGHLTRGVQIFDAFGRIVSPLSEDILNTPMPYGYKVPNIKPYNGIGNPINFLSQFKYSMLNQNLGSVHMCKLFPELLIDNVREWFDSLPAGSIRSYADLMNAFSRSFSQRVEVRHTPAHLLTVKQNRGEPLQDFMTRFDRECLQTRCTNDLLIISAFQNAITSDLIYKEILAKEPQTTTELWAIADKFAKIDEATKRRREGDRGETSDKKKKEDTSRKNVMERIQRGPLESRLGPRQNPAQPSLGPFVP